MPTCINSNEANAANAHLRIVHDEVLLGLLEWAHLGIGHQVVELVEICEDLVDAPVLVADLHHLLLLPRERLIELVIERLFDAVDHVLIKQ